MLTPRTKDITIEHMNKAYQYIDEVAAQYFNKTCCRCGKTRIKQRDVLSMNLKLHGRNVNKFYCKKCLMEQYHWTSENWNQQVNAFKKQGCDLF